ncbi:MATE family efflux transporter [Spirochaetales bacterium NM-380-WT-3C1]|uniref:Multidrug-efflux transporter n=1 Tax=Bullifex porci TaxID=2606638 RepID=A0A7X2PD00_9SPIO|nr:MATE family efflux transporter [Bullifex porci]MSU06671.1 MATE family efflux transporter [Bullifex porci]
MTKQIEKNAIVEGPIWKAILYFFFPILFGTFFQQLYNTVDAVIVGQFLGKQALAAVGGGTSTIINLLIGFFTGLASGASVVISHRYGSGNIDKTKQAINTAMAISIASSIIITAVGLLTAKASLEIIKTPDDILPQALKYMRIYYAGSTALVVYNMGTGVFRALGDSRHPLYFLIIGCICNIILDIIFIGAFKMGVEGAAFATVISQAISMLLTLVSLAKLKDGLKYRVLESRFNITELKEMLRIGLPSGIQSMLYTLSNLLIQSSVNGFGTDTAAAWAAYGKLDCMFWMIINAFGIAITTFVGQNYGAGKTDRVRKGVRTTILFAGGTTIVISLIYCLFARYAYMLFTQDENVINIGVEIIYIIAPTFITYITVEILSGTIRGAGKALVPTVICLTGICGIRVLWVCIVSPLIGTLSSVIVCYPITWVITSILFLTYYKKGKWLNNN